MDNYFREYLHNVKHRLTDDSDKPITYLITVVQLPTGAKEIAINTDNLATKVDYILTAYDVDLCLKTNPAIRMIGILAV